MMKKLFFFGMMGAFALSFVACSSEEEVAPVNPTFDGKTVKAEFALNLPGQYTTRMKTDVTQDGTAFRGITADNLFVYPYKVGTVKDADPVLLADPMIGSKLTLQPVNAFDHQNAQDKWSTQIAVPVETNAFLVYAKATPKEGDAVNGSLTMNGAPAAAAKDITFDLKPINSSEVELATVGADLLTLLNNLAKAEGKPYADVDAEHPTAKKAWYAFDPDADNLYYANLFATFKTLTAGSKTSVEAFLKQLKKSIEAVPVNAGDDGIDKVLLGILGETINAGADFTATAKIPDGAAVLVYDETKHTFSFDEKHFNAGNPLYSWGPNDYVFPAELWWRVNTGIREDAEVQSQNVQSLTWDAFIKTAYQAANNTVKSSSQSVALVNPLQYAVGNFETQIKFADDKMLNITKTTYTYEMTDLLDEEGNPVLDDDGNVIQTPVIGTDGKPVVLKEEVTVTKEVPVSSLKLTGILIGDQRQVDWQALPVKDAPAQVIYDTDLIATEFSTALAVASQTLVLETNQESINVALEFQNNSGIDFAGVNGQIIPNGTKFYLIGLLKNTKEGDTYKVETTGKHEAIFQQDYKTIAKFTINDLIYNAYNVGPDLRTPELEFGLSVDLEWQKGYEFEINIGEAATGDTTTPTTEP